MHLSTIPSYRFFVSAIVLLMMSSSTLMGQVKISNNNSSPDGNAIFQVESDDGAKFHINVLDGKVGIYTTDPTQALDINGDLRIRSLNNGTTMDSILTADSDGVVRMISVNALMKALIDINTDDQQISLDDNMLTLEDGGTVDLSIFLDNTDDQMLSLEGDTLSLEDGGSVVLSSAMKAGPTIYAAGRHRANELDNTESIVSYNSTITRVKEGIFDISFPNIGSENYIIQLTAEDCGGDCPDNGSLSYDAPSVYYIGESISPTGFRIRAGDSDNGLDTLDLADIGFMFSVIQLPGIGSTTENAATPTGTLTEDMSVANLLDEDNNSPWQLGFFGPNYAGSFNYEILLDNVPYTLHNINLGDHTVIEHDNGDGTFDYLFTSTSPIPGFNQYRQITADPPAPTPTGSVGSGESCGCVTFYFLP